MQSDSPHDPGTTPDSRSLTDLWRDLGTAGLTWQRSGFTAAEGKAVIEARNQFDERLDTVADHYAAAGNVHTASSAVAVRDGWAR